VPSAPPPYPPPQAGEGREGGSTRPHVTIRGLSKRFGKAVIYDNFDIDIPRGQLISVFGPNGCGKSTLINMIAGLIPLDAGEILFDGKSISGLGPEAIVRLGNRMHAALRLHPSHGITNFAV